MKCYLYDGSFWGLLTAISIALDDFSEKNRIIAKDEFCADLFTEPVEIATEIERVQRLLFEFKNYLNYEQLQDMQYVFLANEPEREDLLLKYLHLIKISQGAMSKNDRNTVVLKLHRLSNQVAFEVHRYQGLVRFRKLVEGIFYAPIKPKHNVVKLLAPHFIRRFTDQRFVIQDIGRCTGIYYDLHECRYLSFLEVNERLIAATLNLEINANEIYDQEEVSYQKLWCEYFREASIFERKNLKLQRQHLPKKYRDHLVEIFEE